MDNKIKLLVMDVDGTLTDGRIYMGNSGEVFKAFDVKDGAGIHDVLPQLGIIPIIITARNSQIVVNRCNEMGINYVYQNCKDKLAKIKEIIDELNKGVFSETIVMKNVAYIGDDIIDIPPMKNCGLSGCPNDAVNEIKSVANFISSKNGGNGAVREFIEWIGEYNGRNNSVGNR
jgi:3-deoxy-D-manno-octulosonate 8-phosphate phosphatase, YrbI family